MRALHLGICIPDYEALLTHGYGRFLGDGSFAVDVGANVGFHTQVLSTYSRVIAFEPIPEHAERLRSQFADRPNVEVRTVALGRVAGKHEFYHFPPRCVRASGTHRPNRSGPNDPSPYRDDGPPTRRA